MEIAAIIVNYCGKEDTIECVSSMQSGNCIPDGIYIIDNASPDNSGDYLADYYKDEDNITVIMSDSNLGFGSANNLGMKRAFSSNYDYALLINNDTVVDKEMLEKLSSRIDEKTISVPVMMYYDEPTKIWFGGGKFDFFCRPIHEHIGEDRHEIKIEQHDLDFATGCCMLIPKRAFIKTGGFDESYFLYWEDVDWSIRMREVGYRIVINPKAILFHKVSSSTGGEDSPLSRYYGMRNRLYAIRKLSLGFRANVWVWLSLIRGLLSKEKKYAYIEKAWSDYRENRMGKILLSNGVSENE